MYGVVDKLVSLTELKSEYELFLFIQLKQQYERLMEKNAKILRETVISLKSEYSADSGILMPWKSNSSRCQYNKCGAKIGPLAGKRHHCRQCGINICEDHTMLCPSLSDPEHKLCLSCVSKK